MESRFHVSVMWTTLLLFNWNVWTCVPSFALDSKNDAQKVRLVRGSSCLDGAVELLYGGDQWLSVCHNDWWGIPSARSVCCQLGFVNGVNTTVLNPTYDVTSSKRLRIDLKCHGGEEFLHQCENSGPSVGQCVVAAGAVCTNQTTISAGDIIRLSRSNMHKGSGLVKVLYLGEWLSVCGTGWGAASSDVVCRQLGFQHAIDDEYTSDKPQMYGSSPLPALLKSVHCKGTERTLGECEQQFTLVDKCDDGPVEVTCSNTKAPLLSDFQVRLAGGRFSYEGRVEISYRGRWGTVCDDEWGYVDADVVCRQLGYYAAESVESQAYFGEGNGSIILDDLECHGNETNIVDCLHLGIGEHNCKHSEDAGVRCQEVKVELSTLSPNPQSSILHLVVILINGLIALLILAACLIYCSLKMWDKYMLRRHTAHLRQTTQGDGIQWNDDVPMEYMDNPPAYDTVLENRDVYVTQRAETPPPEYNEAIKLQTFV